MRPIIAITMGDPSGIGPEIVVKALSEKRVHELCGPLVIGDCGVMEAAAGIVGARLEVREVADPQSAVFEHGIANVMPVSHMAVKELVPGKPDGACGDAMFRYVVKGVEMAMANEVRGLVTCPINKKVMNLAGHVFNGHTELLARKTGTDDYVMMMAGKRLKVALVTIHAPLRDVAALISRERIIKTVRITAEALIKRFGVRNPTIAVAGLNPHAGEEGMFGDEEKRVVSPAIRESRGKGFEVAGPFPADTVFYHAANGLYQAVVCMYHDQGLGPFKMIHFKDGVNTTLGLPIIRTSVDHGTAYDIAGKGVADPGSLLAAIDMAVEQAS